MIRVANPSIAAWADSTYFRDPEEANRVTERCEASASKQVITKQPKRKAGVVKKK